MLHDALRRVAMASVLLMAMVGPGFGQQSFWTSSDTIHMSRLKGVAIGAGTIYAGGMVGLYALWYADQSSRSFHFFDDSRDWLQMDKAGHAFSAYQLSRLGHGALRWSGMDTRQSTLWAASYSMLFLTSIEVFDGFSDGWGFSNTDFVANLMGPALFAGQQLGWGDQRITLKFSYSGSDLARLRPETLGSGFQEQLFKDYNGQTYWLSVNPSSFFAERRHGKFQWLNAAVGYSATGMLGGAENPAFNAAGENLPDLERARVWLISLDVDFTRIPTESSFLRALFSVLNVFKLPFPALALSSGDIRWHWIYF